MRVTDALDQLSAIHDQLAKAEVYRGYHAVGVALSGLVGLLAAVAQPWLVAADDPAGFVRFWLAAAAVAAALGGGATAHAYLFRDDAYSRRRTRRVAGQFLPCVVAGVVVTLGMRNAGPAEVALLPGLWAVVFGLGVFASRPYLPRATGWVGLFYLTAGGFLLAVAPSGASLSGWGVGGTFGVGQLMTALALHRNVERRDDG
jgi:hypothetical protein